MEIGIRNTKSSEELKKCHCTIDEVNKHTTTKLKSGIRSHKFSKTSII